MGVSTRLQTLLDPASWAIAAGPAAPGVWVIERVRSRRLVAMATSTEDLQVTTPIISLTPEAYKVVKEAIDNEPEPGSLALWLEVRGVQAGSFVYDLFFQATSDADEGDARHTHDELEVIVPAASVTRLRGARLEWSEEGGGGLVLVNPNTPTPEEAAPGVPPEVLARGITGLLAPARRDGARAGGQPFHRQPRRTG